MERFLLLLFQTITVAWAATPDPCLQGVYREINETRRSISYRVQSTEIPLCDINLQFGWYRFTSNAGGEMPTNCVPVNQCGTQMPVWLNGTHPSVTDGIVDRTLCVHFSSRRRARPCCDYVAGTKIKNCGQFYVYYLQPVPTCPMAYCAGTLEPCPPGQIGFKPNCQDIYPRLLNLPHLSGPTIEDGSFYFSCEFETAQQYGSQFFDVIWTVDGQLLPNSNMTIQDTSPKLNGSLLQGHLNKNIEPERLEISEASEERPVTVTATLPKVCTRQVEPDDCMIKINLELSGSANDAAIPNDCVYRIFAANWTDDTKQAKLVINVKARRDHIANNQNRQVMLQFQPVVDNGVFRDAVIEAIPITIHDEAETKCSILGDPHIRGMEYKTSEFYNLYRVGDYTLYENTERLFEVQIRTYKCGSDRVELSCTCGVAIREYDDLIIMDNCNNLRIGRNTVFTTPVYPRGRLSDATTVEKSRDGQQVVRKDNRSC